MEAPSSQMETLVRAVFDNTDLLVWIMSKDGRILLSEGKGLRQMGLTPGQLVGTDAYELYRDAPDVLDCIRRTLAGEEFVASTSVYGRVFENRYSPIRDANGEIIAMLGVSMDVTERHQAQKELERQAAVLKEQAELLDLAADAIIVRRLDNTISYWNRGAEAMYGYSKDEVTDVTTHALLKTRAPKPIEEIEREVKERGHWDGELVHTRRDNTSINVASRWAVKRDGTGAPVAILEINTDITARKRAEEEEAHARRQDEIIRAQALAITELSTPLIPITDEIMVMPLVGVMDTNRASQVMETLLRGISSSSGQFAIIDITGISVVDTQVANALIRSAHAARLLGAEVILTGMRSEVARTLVAIGISLGDVTTRGTLQSGIAYALDRQQKVTLKGAPATKS